MTYGEPIVLKCSTCSGLIKEEIINSGNSIGAIYWTDGKMDAPMFPESHQLIKCPHCKALLWKGHQEKIGTLVSLSTNKKNNSMPYEFPSFEDYYTYLDTNGQFTDKKVIDKDELRYRRFEAWFRKQSKFFMDTNQETPTENQISWIKYMCKEVEKDDVEDYLTLARLKMQLGEIDVVKMLLKKIDLDKELKEDEEDKKPEAIDFRSLHFKLWHTGNDKRRRSNNKPELTKEEKINLNTLYLKLDVSNESDHLFMAEIKRELGDFQVAEDILNNSDFNDLEHYVSAMKTLIKEKDPFVGQV